MAKMQLLILCTFVTSSRLAFAVASQSKCGASPSGDRNCTTAENDELTWMQLKSDVVTSSGGILNSAKRIHSGSPESVSLVDVRRFAENLVGKVAIEDYRMTPVETQAIETIKALVSTMINTSAVTHREDQAEVNSARDQIQKCTNDTAALLSGPVFSLGQVLQAHREAHATCRTTEVAKRDDMTSVCTAYESYLNIEANRLPPACVAQMASLDPTDESQRLEIEACFARSHAWLTPLYSKSTECANKKELHTNQTAECNTKQDTFEESSCTYSAKLNDTCSAQIACRNSSIEARQTTHARVATSESSRKVQYTAGKHILCYFQVFEANNTHKVNTFEECQNLTVNTSYLDILYPEVPQAWPCETDASKPCDSTWLYNEYSQQPWYNKSAMATCQPCPTPAPEPMPTTSPAPPAPEPTPTTSPAPPAPEPTPTTSPGPAADLTQKVSGVRRHIHDLIH